MSSEQAFDQAEGLRRLLLRPSLRVITVVGAREGLGATSVAANLAFALARQDRQVLVLDENLSSDNLANRLALKPRFDLLNTVRDHLRVRDVLLHASARVHVLPLARAMQSLPLLEEEECGRLLENLTAATFGMDVVLVDAAIDGHSICAGLHVDEPLLMVLNATADGITASYAMLKQMVLQHGRRRFDLVVNRVRDEDEARTVFDNMAQAAQRYLSVNLNYLGHIPHASELVAEPPVYRTMTGAGQGTQSARVFAGLAQRLMHPDHAAEQGRSALNKLMARLVQQKAAMPGRKAA